MKAARPNPAPIKLRHWLALGVLTLIATGVLRLVFFVPAALSEDPNLEWVEVGSLGVKFLAPRLPTDVFEPGQVNTPDGVSLVVRQMQRFGPWVIRLERLPSRSALVREGDLKVLENGAIAWLKTEVTTDDRDVKVTLDGVLLFGGRKYAIYCEDHHEQDGWSEWAFEPGWCLPYVATLQDT